MGGEIWASDEYFVFSIFKNLVPRKRRVLEWKIHLDLYVIQFYVVIVFHLVKHVNMFLIIPRDSPHESCL